MAVDTPATIAILGAGPIGLEAALYARFLGYEVQLFEQAEAAHHVLRWGYVTMFTPFGMNSSPLGRAALTAQDADYQHPPLDQLVSGREWADQYLLPLSQSDLLADSIHAGRKVVAVGRPGLLKGQQIGDPRRGDQPFRVLSCDSSGQEFEDEADIVIDTTGVFSCPNWMGGGGIPALGERQARESVEYGLPDVAGDARAHYAGRRTLLVGSGYSAATTIVALDRLAAEESGTCVTWVTRPGLEDRGDGPIRRLADDRLPRRDALAEAANRIAAAPPAGWEYRPQTRVDSIQSDDSIRSDGATESPFEVVLAGEHAGKCRFDRVVANVGYRPDLSLFRELQVHTCYATEGPIKLAAALLGQAAVDCFDAGSSDVETLRNPEPDFYVLGSKSYGRSSSFLFARGLDQIRSLFALIGDREDLDLYTGARSLPQ